MNNIITINKDNKVLIGNIRVKNKEQVNDIANSLLIAIPKEKIAKVHRIALSTLLKGLLNNPEPETKRQKCIHKLLKNESLENIWNDCIKALNIKNEYNNYGMLHILNSLFEEGILEFEVLQEIDAKNQNIVTSKNAMQVFNNSNAIGSHIASYKRKRK